MRTKSLQLCLTFCDPMDGTIICQTPLSMGFSRQEYWSGLPFPSPGKLPNPGIEPWSPALQADCLLTKLQGKSLLKTICHYKLKFYHPSMPLSESLYNNIV